MFLSLISSAQNESYLQPFSNRVSINSSFAGINEIPNFNTGNQFYTVGKDKTYNLFYASYDTYSKKLKAGMAFTFNHGTIGELNTSTTELGFSYAGLRLKTENGQFIAALDIKGLLANKNWFTYLIESTFSSTQDENSPHGKQFTRYWIIKPGASALYTAKSFSLGVSASQPYYYSLNSDDEGYEELEKQPVNLSFYLAGQKDGYWRGLKSKPYSLRPELVVFYGEEFLYGRFHIMIERVQKHYGLFVQSDFTNSLHCLGASFGYPYQNAVINVNAGVGIPGLSEDNGAVIEFSLQLHIPEIQYSKRNPWAPYKK